MKKLYGAEWFREQHTKDAGQDECEERSSIDGEGGIVVMKENRWDFRMTFCCFRDTITRVELTTK